MLILSNIYGFSGNSNIGLSSGFLEVGQKTVTI